ncbi:Rhodanese-like protein [Candidatus Hepatincolaceae symbiont of Richtersius coronifer]
MHDFDITSKELKDLMEKSRENLVIIDVRTLEEYQSGYIESSYHIPMDSLNMEKIYDLCDEKNQYTDLPITVLLYCAAGIRSAKCCYVLPLDQAFDEIRDIKLKNLKNGILEWASLGYSIKNGSIPTTF